MKPHRLDRTLGWRAGVAAVLAVGGLLATPSTGDAIAVKAVAAGDPTGATARFIIQSDGGKALDVGRAAVDLGGRLVASQASLGTVVVDLPVATANRLRAVSGVHAMTVDGQVRLQTAGVGTGENGDMTNVARLTGATTFWRNGYSGQGVDVALLDSGVLPVPGLMTPNKLVIGPDLSFESEMPNLASLDTFGHGTHMAGIIAGRDAGSPPTDGAADSRFVGMAPEARIVSLKLADGQGRTTVAQVLAGIDWVVTHAHDEGLNIRVLNLSFAADSAKGNRLDPLTFAAEVAWAKGIVVVAAAGNGGSNSGGLASPASSPAVIAVGSVNTRRLNEDEHGGDDESVSPWSQSGNSAEGKRSPDLVAPGSSIISLRAKGSYVDKRYASSAAVGERFFRGSGTSQSAAIVSGAAALILSQRPELSPDQVRDVLRRSARPMPNVSSDAQGAGRLDLAAAYGAQTLSVPTTRAAVNAGEVYDRLSRSAKGKRLRHILRLPSAVNGGWSESPAAGATWAGATWAGATWAGATWAGATWAGATWAGATWAGDHWAGATWAGATWAGATWAGATWADAFWAGAEWS